MNYLDESIVLDKIVFRKLKLADASTIFKQVNEMHKSYNEPIETQESIKQDIRQSWKEMNNKKKYQYGILFENNFIGTITATPNYLNKNCELGYYLAKEYWGKGHFHQILKLFLSYLFKLNCNKVYFRVRSDNPRGEGSLMKFGAKKEGVIRAYFFEKGKEVDAYYFGILKREFMG